MPAGDDLEAAVVDRCIIDGDHARQVGVDEAVRCGVLMRSKPGTPGQLVVDLLLVQHDLLTCEVST